MTGDGQSTKNHDDPTRSAATTAWLIERGQSENHVPTVWWIAGPALGTRDGENWTQTAFAATRFPSKEEADAVVESLFLGSRIGEPPTARATEHAFIKRDEDAAATASPDHAEEVSIYLSWVPPRHAKDARAALADLVAERDRLREALREARPYVLWLAMDREIADFTVARDVLAQVDAALAAEVVR